MLHPNYDIISEDFRNRRCGADSDFTYLLRMTLFRASNEADRRYYLCAGEKAKEYRRLSYELEEMASSIEDYQDEGGGIKPMHMAMIVEGLTLSRYLILLDQMETRTRYDALLRYLVQDQEGFWPNDLAA